MYTQQRHTLYMAVDEWLPAFIEPYLLQRNILHSNICEVDGDRTRCAQLFRGVSDTTANINRPEVSANYKCVLINQTWGNMWHGAPAENCVISGTDEAQILIMALERHRYPMILLRVC